MVVREITDLPGGSFSRRHNMAFLPDNKTIAVACWDHHIHLFDITSGKTTGVITKAYNGSVSDLFATPDGQTLVLHNEDREVRVYHVADVLPWPPPPPPEAGK